MKKSLLTAAVVLALSASMAHADSRGHRGNRQQNTSAATEQSVPTTTQQQAITTPSTATTGQTNRSANAVQANGRGQLMLPQGQRSQVSMSNQNSLNQTGNVGSMVIGNQNNVNTGSSVAQMSSTNVQAMQAAPATTMKGHRNRMGTTAAVGTATQETGTAQQVQNQGQAVQKSDISNTVQQTGAISSTVTGGNLNNANAASLSMTSVTRTPTPTASEQVTGTSMRQGRGQSAPTGETALGRQGGHKNGMMSTAIRNEVQQTGAISSTISGGDNNSANAASLAMKGTTLGGGVRNSIVGSGDISAKISGGSDNRANAGSVALGQTSIGGNVVNDVRNTGAISSTIEEGSNNMANAASISIN
jgi:hypothetical protein